MKAIKLIFKILICTFLVGCAKPKDDATPASTAPGDTGSSPSTPVVTPPPPPVPSPVGQWEYELDFTDKLTTSNNWGVVMDTNDVIGSVSLANGWQAEVSND